MLVERFDFLFIQLEMKMRYMTCSRAKRFPHKEIKNGCVNEMGINSRHDFSNLGTVRSNKGSFGTRSQYFSFSVKLARC